MLQSQKQHFVYVIRLKPEISSLKSWKTANPNQVTNECFYVGESAHTPECRFMIHTHEGTSDCICICGCKIKSGPVKVKTSSRKAAKYMIELAPDYFEQYNPIKKTDDIHVLRDAAKQLEEKIAIDIRELGHGAWFA